MLPKCASVQSKDILKLGTTGGSALTSVYRLFFMYILYLNWAQSPKLILYSTCNETIFFPTSTLFKSCFFFRDNTPLVRTGDINFYLIFDVCILLIYRFIIVNVFNWLCKIFKAICTNSLSSE